jgi:hypothetical protein
MFTFASKLPSYGRKQIHHHYLDKERYGRSEELRRRVDVRVGRHPLRAARLLPRGRGALLFVVLLSAIVVALAGTVRPPSNGSEERDS